jgi:hypothetical protein
VKAQHNNEKKVIEGPKKGLATVAVLFLLGRREQTVLHQDLQEAGKPASQNSNKSTHQQGHA